MSDILELEFNLVLIIIDVKSKIFIYVNYVVYVNNWDFKLKKLITCK